MPADGTYDLAATWPTETGAASDATYTLTTGTGSSAQSKDYTADQTTSAGAWNDLASVALTKGEQVTLTLKPSADGTVSADAVRLVRDASADTDNEHKAFAYSYDLNGNLTGINDTSSDTGVDEYSMAYDGLNQITSVKEALAGQEKATTSYTYDSLGDPLTVKHPDQDSTYTYDDPRHLLTKVSVDDLNDSKGAKDTSYTYDLLGRVQTETKGNQNVVSYDYQPDSAVLHQTENTSAGNLVASHDYTYNANGDQLTDDAKKRSGDDASTVLDSSTTYTYDPVDRIETKVKTGHASSSESYVHDANANVTSQVIDSDTTDTTVGDETTFSYDRNRLTSSTSNPGDPAAGSDQTSSYRYDAFGRQTSVIADPDGDGPAGKEAVSRTSYDGFDHVKSTEKQATGSGAQPGDMDTTRYTYDPLDRRTSQTTHADTDKSKTTDYSYLGLSSEVIGDKVGDQLTKTYQYSPWGQRLSQISQTADASKKTQAGDTGYYSYNSHDDVEDVTGDNGDTTATYGYTAYGQTDKKETTGADKPDDSCDTGSSSNSTDPGSTAPTSPADPGGSSTGDTCDPGDPGQSSGDDQDQYNAFRYNADRQDAADGTYDMGFRDYDPSLNTFTSRDSYNGALDDLDLGSDPYTGSRYAFGAGNPISNIELDGHRVVSPDGYDGSTADVDRHMAKVYAEQQAEKQTTEAWHQVYRNVTPDIAKQTIADEKKVANDPEQLNRFRNWYVRINGIRGNCNTSDSWICPAINRGVHAGTIAARILGGEDIIKCAADPGANASCAASLPVGRVGRAGRAVEDAASAVSKADIAPSKFDYLFGKVASNDHNLKRSLQNERQLRRIGVYDNAESRELIQRHLSGVVKDDSNIVGSYSDEYGTFQIRDSLFSGPQGTLKFESTWQVTDDGYRLTTVIPFGHGG